MSSLLNTPMCCLSDSAKPQSAESAHTKGSVISGLAFSPDGSQLASRSSDGTVKRESGDIEHVRPRMTRLLLAVWDSRTLKKPIATASDLPSLNPESNIIFSPDGSYILTGTAGSQAGVLEGSAEAERIKEGASLGQGKVVILLRKDLSVFRKLGMLAQRRAS